MFIFIYTYIVYVLCIDIHVCLYRPSRQTPFLGLWLGCPPCLHMPWAATGRCSTMIIMCFIELFFLRGTPNLNSGVVLWCKPRRAPNPL